MRDVAFSIATPTYNALAQLRRCVGSVRGQVGVDYEHLVQDGRSSDGSADWLSSQAAADPSLRFVSETDSGMYDAIARAWRQARGRYLSWLNSDEQLLPGTLSCVQDYFERHPQVDAVFADYVVVDEQGEAIAFRREIPLRRFYVANTFLYAQSCTLFYRRCLFDKGLLSLDTRYRYAADKDLILRLLTADVRIEHLPIPLALFGVDGNNLSTHPAMLVEAEKVRLAYGGFRFRPARALAFAGRRLERLLAGAYRPIDLDYKFAVDERPRYEDRLASAIGGRYSLQTPAKRSNFNA